MSTITADTERLAVLEQKVTDLTTQFITKTNEMGSDLREIKDMVQNKLNDHITMIGDINTLKKDVRELKNSAAFWKVIIPLVSALAGGLFLFLVEEYFKTH